MFNDRRKYQKRLILLLIFLFSVCISCIQLKTEAMVKGKKPQASNKIATPKPVVNGINSLYNLGDQVNINVVSTQYAKSVNYRVVVTDISTQKNYDITKGYSKPTNPAKAAVFKYTASRAGSFYVTVYAAGTGVKTIKPEFMRKSFKVYNGTYMTNANTVLVSKTVNGDLYIGANNITVNNVKVKGTIFINPGKDGVTNLNKVSAANIKVLSGGENSIHFNGVTVDKLTVDSSSNVRIVSGPSTKIGSTIVSSYAVLDKQGGTLGNITIVDNGNGSPVITLKGIFTEPISVESGATIKTEDKGKDKTQIPSIQVQPVSANSKVTLSGNFQNVQVNKSAELNLDNNAKIGELKVNSETQIKVAEGADVTKIDIDANDKDAKVSIDGSSIGIVHVSSAANIILKGNTNVKINVESQGVNVAADKGATANIDTNGNKVTNNGNNDGKIITTDLTDISNKVDDKLAEQKSELDNKIKNEQEAQKNQETTKTSNPNTSTGTPNPGSSTGTSGTSPVLSSEVFITSSQWTVNNSAGTITNVPGETTIGGFKAAIIAPTKGSFDVYQGDGTTKASDLKTGYKVITTAENGDHKTYVITLNIPLSTIVTVTSSQWTINDTEQTITNVPAETSLINFRAGILAPSKGNFEVYQGDGVSKAADLQTGYKVITTAENGNHKIYIITLNAPLSNTVTITSSQWLINGDAGTITNIPADTTLTSFKAGITAPGKGSFDVYQGDGITKASDLQSGYKVITTAENGGHKTYAITLNALVIPSIQTASVASNGTLTVTLSSKPSTAPAAGDFSATYNINGAGNNQLQITSINYDGDKTVTCSFTAIAKTVSSQNISVSVAYKNTAAATSSFVIAPEFVSMGMIFNTSSSPIPFILNGNDFNLDLSSYSDSVYMQIFSITASDNGKLKMAYSYFSTDPFLLTPNTEKQIRIPADFKIDDTGEVGTSIGSARGQFGSSMTMNCVFTNTSTNQAIHFNIKFKLK